MLTDIKKLNGICNDEFDTIIQSYIDAAKLDLEMVGIDKSNINDEDKLVYSAIVSYVQTIIDVNNSEMHRNSYNLQKDALRHYHSYKKGE